VAPLVPVDVRRFAERATPRGARAEQRRRFEKLAPADRHDSFLAIMRASYTQFAITRDQLHACPRSNAARTLCDLASRGISIEEQEFDIGNATQCVWWLA